MATAKLGLPNYIEPGLVALSGGSWGTTLDNLKDGDFGLAAVSTDATTGSTELFVDASGAATALGVATPVADCLMIPKHNLSQSATIRVKGGSAAFTAGGGGGGSVVYDSTAIAALTQNVYPVGYTSVFGRVTTATVNPLIDNAYNRAVLVLFGATYGAKFWYIGINDTGNTDGFVSLARAFLGPLYQPTQNMDFGASIELTGDRVADVTSTNAESIDPLRKLRRMANLSLSDIPLDEATAIFMRIQLFLGYARQCAFIFDPSDTFHQPLRSFMATQLKASGISYQNFGTGHTGLSLQEVL